MGKVELLRFSSDRELAESAAAQWLDAIAATMEKRRHFLVALSGGRITRHLFSNFAQAARGRALPLAGVHFFWADERCVPPQSADSNFALADEMLFKPLAIPTTQIHRLRGEIDGPQAAHEMSSELTRLAPTSAIGQPVFDLVLLGMGEDGHIASLFPNATNEVIETKEPYLPIANSPKPPPERLTLSYATVAAAAEVWVLASGAGKEEALRRSLGDGGQTPLGRVIQLRTHTKILTDIE
jgi:6-phosphogluconolactonase